MFIVIANASVITFLNILFCLHMNTPPFFCMWAVKVCRKKDHADMFIVFIEIEFFKNINTDCVAAPPILTSLRVHHKLILQV